MPLHPMIGENQQLVTNEPVEVQDCRKITDHFRGIYRIYPHLIKESRRMSTCNRLNLQTPGSPPVIMPKNLPSHCLQLHAQIQYCCGGLENRVRENFRAI